MKKIIICQPLDCGLNDTLCQIGLCIKYSRDYNRKLIIDTERHSGMVKDFGDYFVNNNIDNKDFIQLSLSDIELDLLGEQTKSLLTSSKPLSVDFLNNHEEEVLVHRSSGGGLSSAYALDFFKLQPNLAQTIQNKLNSMPDGYCSVFIRNTDYRTNYKELFEFIKSDIGDRYLLVCTDDYHVIDYAKTQFSKLICNEDIERNAIPARHAMRRCQRHLDHNKVNIDAITDLILGAASMKLYPSVVSFPYNIKSGFVALGTYLNENKNIINNLLTR